MSYTLLSMPKGASLPLQAARGLPRQGDALGLLFLQAPATLLFV